MTFPARPLLGMYALLAMAVGCVGASAGELFFTGDGTLSTPFEGTENRCLFRYPLAVHLQQLDRCEEGSYRSQGLFVLGCVGGMLLLTAALMVIVPWLAHRRLTRTRQFTGIEGVTARFGALCDHAGLTGRRRPRLVVAAVPEAYTIALPGGQPLVVLPVTVALGWAQPGLFDPVVMHELAHVRARDVSLVSSVRGIAWVTIPALALASLPEFLAAGQTQVQRAYLIQAAVFVTVTVLVAAGLLRVREIAADRQAARWLDSPETLQNLLDKAGPAAGTGRRRRWWRRVLARHPSLRARRMALRNPLIVQEAGFATAVAVGAVATMAMNTGFYFASSLHHAAAEWLPIRVWAAAGGIVLALGLVPALTRSADQARRADVPVAWWAPAAGVSIGLVLGSLVAPGLTPGVVVSVIIGSAFPNVATVIVLAGIGAGIAAFTGGLASLAAGRRPQRPSWLVAGLTAVIVCCAAAALLPVRSLFSLTTDSHFLAFSLAGDQWRLLLLLYPAAVIALAVPIPSREVRGAVRADISAALVPVGAAVIGTVVFLAQRHPDASQGGAVLSRWLQEDGWACAFTGCAVLAVLALARGIPGLARACLAAWLTTLLVYAGSIGYEDLFRGHPFHLLSGWVAMPSMWLFYLALPTSLLALLPIRRPAEQQKRWLLPAGVSAGAAAAAVLVFVTGVSGLIEPPALPSPFPSSPCGEPGTAATASLPSLALDANQVLSRAAARKVADSVCAALPASWVKITSAAAGASSGRETVRPSGCAQLDAELFLRALGRPLTQAQDQYQITTGSIAGNETLSVVVNSLARAAPSALFAVAGKDLASCHRYRAAQAGVTAVVTARGFSVAEAGARTWGVDFMDSLRAKGKFAAQSTTWVMASIGRDLIVVIQQTIALGVQPPPDHAVTAAALTAAVAAFRQSALSAAQACPRFRHVTLALGHEIAGVGDNGFSSAQRAAFRAYGAAVTQLGQFVARSGSDAGLVRDLELMGAASGIVGRAPKPNAEEAAALTEYTKVYPLVRKACIAIGSWPK